ncbi:hypothetical protein SAMN05660691_04048 [Rheinheimera pacifica]|uniref:Uncharacterized protein n=2 Tax=Rheinheimera pacifica TaxID=173990 RepID=A0A1H6NIG8_9GAMM|nr:hypothetical protein SAMN05660691_04048 [Rheinheimera pacifica]
MNSGYGVEEGNWLNKRDRELFKLIGVHCSSPNLHSSSGDSRISSFSDTATVKRPAVSLSDMPDWRADNAIFKGDKSAAWSEYYQVPVSCRQKNLSEDDFVKCAEHKTQQRKQFDAAWNNLKFTPLTAGTSQAPAPQLQGQTNQEILTAFTIEQSTNLVPTQHSVSVDKDFHKHFTWFGVSFVVFVAGACWIIWRK